MWQFKAALAIDPTDVRTLSHYGCFLHTACVDYKGAAEVFVASCLWLLVFTDHVKRVHV